jgi:hypothetical protein
MGMRPNQGGGLEARKIGYKSKPKKYHARAQFEYCTCSPKGADDRGACPWHRLCREAARSKTRRSYKTQNPKPKSQKPKAK